MYIFKTIRAFSDKFIHIYTNKQNLIFWFSSNQADNLTVKTSFSSIDRPDCGAQQHIMFSIIGVMSHNWDY